VVRQRSAKPLFSGSNPLGASSFPRPNILSAASHCLRVTAILLSAVLTLSGATKGLRRAFDTTDSRPVDAADSHAILAAICPDNIVFENDAGRIRGGCSVCPAGFRFSAGFGRKLVWSAHTAVQGHFLGPESDDVVVAMAGCEPHSHNFGGSVVLTRRNNKLQKRWYLPGVNTDRCRTVRLRTGRDILLCEEVYSQAGVVEHYLYTIDMRTANRPRPRELLRVTDTMGACYGTSRQASIEDAKLHDIDGDGQSDLTVTVQYGTRKVTEADRIRFCSGPAPAGLPQLATKPHQFRFLLRSNRFVLAPGSLKPDLLAADGPE
jgi:hypothetical protein